MDPDSQGSAFIYAGWIRIQDGKNDLLKLRHLMFRSGGCSLLRPTSWIQLKGGCWGECVSVYAWDLREEVLLTMCIPHNGGCKPPPQKKKMEVTPDAKFLFHSFWKEPPSERFRESLCYYPERRGCENFHSEERRVWAMEHHYYPEMFDLIENAGRSYTLHCKKSKK